MRFRNSVGRRSALWLAVAALGAGLMSGPWGTPLKTEMRALVTGAPTGHSAPAHVPVRPGNSGAVPRRSSPASPAVSAEAAVAAAVAERASGRPADSVSIAAVDTATGVRVTWGAGTRMTTASVFKLLLLEGYLLQNQDRGQAPGDGESDALTAMIENSDNDRADEVYAALDGHAGLASTLRRLGLSATVLGPHDQWGLSTTNAADQLTLLTDLVSTQSPLSSASRAYALELMTSVEADQRWGVGAAADPGTSFANKNGWLDLDDDDGRWVVSSVGVIRSGGHQVLMAVLTQHDADLSDGTALVESLSRTVATALRATASAADPGPISGSQPQG